MKKVALLLAIVLPPLWANAQTNSKASWHFPVALTYASGFKDVTDAAVGNFSGADKLNIPCGLSFSPYLEFASGVGVGLDVGPFMLVYVNVTRGSHEDDAMGFLAPLGVYVRYDFIKEGAVSPYVRAGVRQCFVTGDIFDKGSAGVYGNVGIELSYNRSVKYGLEAGIDTSKVDVFRYNSSGYLTSISQEVKPYKFTLSAFVSF